MLKMLKNEDFIKIIWFIEFNFIKMLKNVKK